LSELSSLHAVDVVLHGWLCPASRRRLVVASLSFVAGSALRLDAASSSFRSLVALPFR
jgi:hypothetical protein